MGMDERGAFGVSLPEQLMKAIAAELLEHVHVFQPNGILRIPRSKVHVVKSGTYVKASTSANDG